MSNATTATTPTPRKRGPRKPKPATATNAIADITRIRAKAAAAEQAVLEALPEADRRRVLAFMNVDTTGTVGTEQDG